MSELFEQPVVGEPGQAGAGEAVAAPTVSPPAAVAGPATESSSRPRRKGRSDEEVAYWRAFVDEWHRLVAEASAARVKPPTVRGFCDERQLREPSFYWWRRELAIRDGKPLPTMRSADSTRIVSHMGTHAPVSPPNSAFVQLRVKPTTLAPTAPLCEIVVGKVVVRVALGFDANELSRLLDVFHAR
jgi:hypothetical protein